MNQKTKIIVVEGFDGAGKTTLARWLSEFLNYNYHKSPTGIFSDVRNYFDKENVLLQDRLCFYFADCMRISILLSTTSDNYVLDRYYFSTIAYHESKQKGITDSALGLFYNLTPPDIVLLIKTDFDVLSKRIQRRDEKSLNDELFLKKELYDSIYNLYAKYINVPCIVIDNNGSEENSKEQIKSALSIYNYF